MAEGKFTNETIELNEAQQKSRRARNIALACVLAAFVIILYVASWAKLGTNLFNRPL